MDERAAIQLYELWVNSNYVALPFSGAFLEQPWYIVADFEQLSAIDGWHQRQKEKRDKVRDRAKRPSGQ